jgi:hypothetical protein
MAAKNNSPWFNRRHLPMAISDRRYQRKDQALTKDHGCAIQIPGLARIPRLLRPAEIVETARRQQSVTIKNVPAGHG